ncbi:MAG: VWA domain-containing protein [Verrucomicrobiota bacterium]
MRGFSSMVLLGSVETSFRFAYPWVLFLLLILPFFWLLRGRAGQEASVAFSSLHILRHLGKPSRARFGIYLPIFLTLATAGVIIGLARPQMINTEETVTDGGIEMIIAIDVSRSMQAMDFKLAGRRVDRLTAAKKVTRDFIRGRTTDRIGLIAFSGRPYLASPLTMSHSWLEGAQGLGRVRIGLVEDGTAIGSAIAASAKRLDKREAKSKVIVLLTDGKSNSGKLTPLEAAKLAKTLNVRVYPIAVGTYGDYVVQTPVGPKRISDEYDEETLQEIAQIADGQYFRAQDTSSLEKIFASIDELEKTEIKRQVKVEASEFYHYAVIPALAFAILGLVFHETLGRRFP